MWIEFKLTYKKWDTNLDPDSDKLPLGTLVIGDDMMNDGDFAVSSPDWGYNWSHWQPIRLQLNDLRGRGFGHDQIIEALYLNNGETTSLEIEHIQQIFKGDGICYVEAAFDHKLNLPTFPVNKRIIISLTTPYHYITTMQNETTDNNITGA